MGRRLFSSFTALRSHENPLGLPRAGTPPSLAARMQRGLPQRRRLRDVKKVVAVSSAKGGVGKSTIAGEDVTNQTVTQDAEVQGILDTDIFGPSIPTLFNLTDAEEPRLSDNNQLVPLTNYGVKTMSMGYLTKPSDAIVWRGLMVTKALQQLLHEVDWGGLDVLVLDLPPGTGDTQLTIAQQLELDGTVIVSTPQLLSLSDAVRGIAMFEKTNTPILGMVQNMSHFHCPNCQHDTPIFGPSGAVAAECRRRGIPVIGDVPLDARVCEDADRGKPSVVAEPDGVRAKVFMDIARAVGSKVGL